MQSLEVSGAVRYIYIYVCVCVCVCVVRRQRVNEVRILCVARICAPLLKVLFSLVDLIIMFHGNKLFPIQFYSDSPVVS
jgi:hypothetical protein